MRRREFIALIGGTAAGWPLGVRAQQQPMPVIGFLSAISSYGPFLVAFRRGLAEAGCVEGENVTIEYRWAEGRYDRLPELASELVRRQVAVIVAAGGNQSARAAKAATTTIPIVFYSGDPVAEGLVSSLNRPGGNMTGMSTFAPALGGKRVDLLRELLPRASALAMLINPNYAPAAAEAVETENAAQALGHKLSVFKASSEGGIEAAFATLAQQRPDALIVGADPFFNSRREQLATLAMRNSIPAIYVWREFVVAGGLMSYGDDFADGYRQVGIYVGRILKGANPADLPVIRPTKFELVINLKTAKSLGIAVPEKLLALADELIE
jgi:putative tryptophan/tyrosine transport system substrate-binding protein